MSSEAPKRDVAAAALRPAAGVPRGRILVVTPSRCTGCRTCELACAVSHGRQMMPARSRVRAYSYSEKQNIPILCLQCDEAACVRACPVTALVRNETTGAVEVAEERCILCNLCITACPFGNIYIDPGTSGIVKCDLCRGNPICAQFCPTGALSFEPAGR